MTKVLRGVAPISPYILEDVEVRSRQILEEARRVAAAEAEALVSTARSEADRIRTQAEKEGREKGLAQGITEGREKGLAEGRQEALAKVAPAWETAQKAITEAAGRLEGAVAEVTTRADEKVLALAYKIGQIVLKREISIDPNAFRANLQAALKAAARTGHFRVRLHPEDLATLQGAFEEFKPLLPATGVIEWVGDEHVERAGVVVETAVGDVDGGIATQLAQIEEAVLGRAAGGKR